MVYPPPSTARLIKAFAMSLETELRGIVREEVHRLFEKTKRHEPDRWLSTKEAAELSGLSVAYFENARSQEAANQPPYSRIGRRILYRQSALVAWLSARVEAQTTGRQARSTPKAGGRNAR